MLKKKLYGIMTLLVGVMLVFSIAGCSSGGAGGGGGGGKKAEKVTYKGNADGVEYTLEITQNTAKAAYTPTGGDAYKLTAGAKTSNGKVVTYNAGALVLQPKDTAAAPISVTVTEAGLTGITGVITWDDGTEAPAPGTLTPGTPAASNPFVKAWEGGEYDGSGAKGTLTFTSEMTWTMVWNSSNGMQLNNEFGTYTRSGNNAILTVPSGGYWSNKGNIMATISGVKLTVTASIAGALFTSPAAAEVGFVGTWDRTGMYNGVNTTDRYVINENNRWYRIQFPTGSPSAFTIIDYGTWEYEGNYVIAWFFKEPAGGMPSAIEDLDYETAEVQNGMKLEIIDGNLYNNFSGSTFTRQ